MAYEETVLRMVRLMFVFHEKWCVDGLLRNLTGDWFKLRRMEERFAGPIRSRLSNFLHRGHSLLFSNFTTTGADLDASFEIWFKKVSSDMWRFHSSTDVNNIRIPCGLQKIEAVFDQNPPSQRVCILQGPAVAAKWSSCEFFLIFFSFFFCAFSSFL